MGARPIRLSPALPAGESGDVPSAARNFPRLRSTARSGSPAVPAARAGGETCLAVCNRALAAERDFHANGELPPERALPRSMRRAGWGCSACTLPDRACRLPHGGKRLPRKAETEAKRGYMSALNRSYAAAGCRLLRRFQASLPLAGASLPGHKSPHGVFPVLAPPVPGSTFLSPPAFFTASHGRRDVSGAETLRVRQEGLGPAWQRPWGQMALASPAGSRPPER